VIRGAADVNRETPRFVIPNGVLDERVKEVARVRNARILALGVGLCHALSKLLITLGLEPQNMPTTVLPTPGAR